MLGAAGLLQGYRAACHWTCLDQLTELGAEPMAERVVVDRDRITGARVTSGIDFALTLAARIRGDDVAKEIQLGMEYDTDPPFATGSPKTAPDELVARQKERLQAFSEKRLAATRKAAGALVRDPAS